MQVFHINYSLSSTNTIIDTCFTNRKKKSVTEEERCPAIFH